VKGKAKDMRIDYAFVDETMKNRVLSAWIDETAQGSDHQPIWLELDYAPHNGPSSRGVTR